MNELTLWGKTLSISIKTQKKYHSLRVRIELNSFKAAAFDRKDWTTDLGGIPVRWFPASWTLKERKKRERFQAAIIDIPESMTLETLWRDRKPTQFLAQTTGQAFKLVNTGKGKRKLIVYCENWQSLHTLLSLRSSLEDHVFQWVRHSSPSHQPKPRADTSSSSTSRKDSNPKCQNPNNTANKLKASSQKLKSALTTNKGEKQTRDKQKILNQFMTLLKELL
jgi:hypothetical protein